MRQLLTSAKSLSLAATVLILTAAGSGAAAQQNTLSAASEPTLQTVPVPAAAPSASGIANAAAPQPSLDLETTPAVNAATLTQLVARQPQGEEVSSDINCLAGAVYFEARNETLDGQLAVARVVVARSRSGRFPDSYCGVVYQPSQFSFVHGGAMPVINHASAGWHRALAIAEIAHDGSWQSPVEGAMFFHSARISPRWHRQRVARIDNHVFYR